MSIPTSGPIKFSDFRVAMRPANTGSWSMSLITTLTPLTASNQLVNVKISDYRGQVSPIIWLRGTELPAAGTSLSRWPGAGNGRANATCAAVTSGAPTSRTDTALPGHNVVELNKAGGNYIHFPNDKFSTGWTGACIFMVYKDRSTSGSFCKLVNFAGGYGNPAAGNNALEWAFRQSNFPGRFLMYGGGSSGIVEPMGAGNTSPLFFVTNWNVYSAFQQANAAVTVSRQGQASTINTINANFNFLPGNGDRNICYIGRSAWADTDGFGDGFLAEFIMYNKALPLSTASAVTQYLRTKYSL